MAIDPGFAIGPPFPPWLQILIDRARGAYNPQPPPVPWPTVDPQMLPPGWRDAVIGDPGLRPLPDQPIPAPPLPRDYGGHKPFAGTPGVRLPSQIPANTWGRETGRVSVPDHPSQDWQMRHILGNLGVPDYTDPRTPWPGIKPPVWATPKKKVVVVNPNTFGPRQPNMVGVGLPPRTVIHNRRGIGGRY